MGDSRTEIVEMVLVSCPADTESRNNGIACPYSERDDEASLEALGTVLRSTWTATRPVKE
jgi:hypothetical protein